MWESVYAEPYDTMDRMQVDGGWLYRNRLAEGGVHASNGLRWTTTIAFVPTPAVAPGQREAHARASPPGHAG